MQSFRGPDLTRGPEFGHPCFTQNFSFCLPYDDLNYLKKEQAWNVLHFTLDAADNDFGVHDLGEAQENPWQVGHHEQRDDGDGYVGHVDFFGVTIGPSLVQQQDPLANANVKDHKNQNWCNPGSR